MRMRHKYDFRISPKPISSKGIARHQDFDALLKAHESGARRSGIIQMRHLMYAGTGLVAAAIALFLILRIPATPGAMQDEQAFWAEQPFVAPPMPPLTPEFTALNVEDVTVSQTIIASNGNPRFIIPEMAFMDDRGNPVQGTVEIFFRKLDDFVDFFLAGIMLTHDSAGVRRQLESGGMVEIYAEQNGQRVYLAPGKVIAVEFESEMQLASTNNLPEFHVYYLDSDVRTWVDRGPGNTQLLGEARPAESDPGYSYKTKLYETLAEIDATSAQELAQLEVAMQAPVPPVKPERSDPNQPTLELDFLEGAVPETASGDQAKMYQGTIWQISPRSPAYDQRAFGVTWQSARLRQLDGSDYELILTHNQSSLRLLVNPVLTGSAYEQAMDAYRKAYAEYERAYRQWQESMNKERLAIRQKHEKSKEAARKLCEKQMTDAGIAASSMLRVKFQHRMEISQLGLWSVAHPLPSTPTVATGRITDQHENAYNRRIAYVVNPEQNTLHQILIGGNNRIPLAPGSMLWAVSPDGKIAVLRPKELQQAFAKVTSAKLVMELQEQQPDTEEELRRLLQLQRK